MGFWIFMLIMVLLIPLFMIIFGAIYTKHPPKEINYLTGYRTNRSMSSKDAWDFAHRLFGKIWLICGIISLPVFAVAMLFFIGKSDTVVGTVGAVITFVEFLPMIIPVFFVERELKRNFDENGIRKEPKVYDMHPKS